ncbi:MAG TPA: hypothetical protein VHI95_09170 [Acidimicrobiales bacterium]|jgi:hypothetical protein|nr:hypothetical protein [Acidimicrobiales bacterium]
MTDTTTIERATAANERDEALEWLARRVRWEHFLTSLRETSTAADDSDELVRQPQAA